MQISEQACYLAHGMINQELQTTNTWTKGLSLLIALVGIGPIHVQLKGP